MKKTIKICLIVAVLLILSCSAFDSAEYESVKGKIKADLSVDKEKLKESGEFSDKQIETLEKAFIVETDDSDYNTYSVRLSGKPANEDIDLALPGMSLSIRDIIDPAEHSAILYWIGGGLVVLGVVGGYFLGWGLSIIVGIFGVGLIAIGRFMASTWLVALLPGAAILIGAGYIVYRLYRGKEEHQVLKDIAIAFDEFDDEEEVKKFLDDKRKHKDVSVIEKMKQKYKKVTK